MTNTAIALGDSPSGTDDVTDTSGTANDNDTPTVTPLDPAAAIALVKTSAVNDVNGNGVTDLGDVIDYTFTVENTGNVTLSNIDINDQLLGGIVGTVPTLAVGATDASVTGSYTIVQSDIDAGNVTNTAIALGDSPSGIDDVTDTSGTANDNDDPTVTPLGEAPSITVTLTADQSQIDPALVGDEITYTTVVTNDGNVTLSNVDVRDELGTLVETIPTLAVGSAVSVTYTRTYTLTANDLVAAELNNTVIASGTSPAGITVSDTASVTTGVVVFVDLIEQIEEQLTQILEDDLRVTTTNQSRLFSDIARGARDRLAAQSTEACVAELNSFVQSNPILFDTALAVLKPQSGPVLDEVANILASCENGRIEIGGHTDSRGSDAYNIDLSQRRVNSVMAALEQRRVNTQRLTARGYGERQPIADNSTVEGLAQNRRVVFTSLDTAIVADEPCGTITPFGTRGTTTATDGSMNSDQEFGSEYYNCVTGVRQIIRGDLSLSKEDGFGTQGTLSATIQRERMVNKNHLSGFFAGGYMSRSNIDGSADGTIEGYGVWSGLYGANRFYQNMYLDYYLAGSIGRHSYDLRFSDLPIGVDISADGSYSYWGLFAGLAVSGDAEFNGVDVTPRAGVDLRYASAWDASVTAQIPGISQSGSLSIDDQKGHRAFAEVRFGFGDDPNSGGDLGTASQFNLTPRLYCDMLFESGTDDACGVGLNLEYRMDDFSNGTAWGVDLDGETSGDIDRVRFGIYYERSVLDGNGQLNLGADVTQDGTAQLTGGFGVQF